MYILESGGEIWPNFVMENIDQALEEAKNCVDQYICDFQRHNLPKNTKDEDFDPDVRVYYVSKKNELELPLQEWTDEYYQRQKEYVEKDKRREYKRYLELKEKYENS